MSWNPRLTLLGAAAVLPALSLLPSLAPALHAADPLQDSSQNPLYRIVALDSGVEGFPAVRHHSLAPIWGVETVMVALDMSGATERLLGFSHQAVLDHVTGKLKEQGIEVRTIEDVSSVPGGASICVQLNAAAVHGSPLRAIHMSVSLNELSVPMRNPNVVTSAAVWSSTYLGMAGINRTERVAAQGLNHIFAELRRDRRIMEERAPKPAAPEESAEADSGKSG